MMLFLIGNVLINIFNLGMGIRKSTISFLPRKFSLNKFLFVDEIGRIVFDVSY